MKHLSGFISESSKYLWFPGFFKVLRMLPSAVREEPDSVVGWLTPTTHNTAILPMGISAIHAPRNPAGCCCKMLCLTTWVDDTAQQIDTCSHVSMNGTVDASN